MKRTWFIFIFSALLSFPIFVTCVDASGKGEVISITCDESNFPDYYDLAKIRERFGVITIDFAVSGIDPVYGRLIESVSYYSNVSGVRHLIAVISKRGVFDSEMKPITAFRVNPDSDFFTKFFVGFSEKSFKRSFALKGIAISTDGSRTFETETIYFVDLDYINNTIKPAQF